MTARADYSTDWGAVGSATIPTLEAFAAQAKACETAIGIGDDGGLQMLTPTEHYAMQPRLIEGFRAHTATIRAYAEAFFDASPRTELPHASTPFEYIAAEIARRRVILRFAYPENSPAQFQIGFAKEDRAEIATLSRSIRQHQATIENLLFAFEIYEDLTPSTESVLA